MNFIWTFFFKKNHYITLISKIYTIILFSQIINHQESLPTDQIHLRFSNIPSGLY